MLFRSVTSTTVAMLTSDSGDRYIDPGRDSIDEALERETWSTLEDIGGTPIALQVPMLEVAVLGRTSNGLSTPELHLFAAQGVIGT